MKNGRHNIGVTLVEMLVVISIIAVLATAIITLTRAMDTQSKEQGTANVFALLRTALQEYREDTGSFPAQDEVYAQTLYQVLDSTPSSRQVIKQINGSLLKVLTRGEREYMLICDPWGKPVKYVYVDGAQFPELISAGPDKTFGTADDISSRGK